MGYSKLKGLDKPRPIKSRIGLLQANQEEHKSFLTGTLRFETLITKDQAKALGIKPKRVHKGK